MKTKFKVLIMALVVCALSVFTVCMSGCNVKEKIEQARCEHEWSDVEITVQPTCQSVGEKTKVCILCDTYETEKLAQIAHSEVPIPGIEATCTKSGLSVGVKCPECEKVLVPQEVIPALGHDIVTEEKIEPTCTEDGETAWTRCIRCFTVYDSWSKIPALGHTYGTGEVLQRATCSLAGVEKHICLDCGYELLTELPALGGECADTDDDGLCDVCGYAFHPLEGTYVEVEATVGETVAGNWYRVYKGNVNNYIKITSIITIEDWSYYSELCVAQNGDKVGIGSVSATEYISKDNDLIKIVESEDYFDIYFSIGSFETDDFIHESTSVDPITEDTVISWLSSDSGHPVYRLHILSKDCVDTDGDSKCDVCGYAFHLLEGTYVEVEATVGETVAGNWYRVYKGTNSNYIKITSIITIEDWSYFSELCVAQSGDKVVIGSGSAAEYISKDNDLIKIVESEDYFDVYFSIGSFETDDFIYESTSVDPITEDTVISFLTPNPGSPIYRLHIISEDCVDSDGDSKCDVCG